MEHVLQAFRTSVIHSGTAIIVGAKCHPEEATGGPTMLAGEFAMTGLTGVDVGRLSALTLKGSRTLLMM